MNEMKASFLNTLRSLRDAQLRLWDEENANDLNDAELTARDSAAEVRNSSGYGLDELEDVCSDFISNMETFNELRLARKDLENKWNNIIVFAEQNL